MRNQGYQIGKNLFQNATLRKISKPAKDTFDSSSRQTLSNLALNKYELS